MKKLFLIPILFLLSIAFSVDFGAFSFDIGSEPFENGNKTYGTIEYAWTNIFSSSFNIIDTSSNKTDDNIDGYSDVVATNKNHTLEINTMPFIIYFGKKDYEKPTANIQAGFWYQYTKSDYFVGMFDTNGIMLDECDKGKYFTIDNDKKANIFGLKIGSSARYPFTNFFAINGNIQVSPIYFVIMNQNICYHSNQTTNVFNYSNSNKFTSFSTPYIETKIGFEFFDTIRLISIFKYQRLNLEVFDWTSGGNSLTNYKDTQDMKNLRFGIEFMAGKQQTAKIRGGIYYEKYWNISSYSCETTSDGKFIFSIGTEK